VQGINSLDSLKSNRLQSLDLTYSDSIGGEQILAAVLSNGKTLRKICIDGENCSQLLLIKIIESMGAISGFKILFNQEFDDALVNALSDKIHYSN
jgi:hypothetical protein